MKKLNTLILLFLVASVMAQTEIPEGGFNNWTPSSAGNFSEPSGGWWTSLNSLQSLGGPVTLSASTDAHSGEYAAQMETKLWGTLLISGLLVAGDFITSDPFIKQGKPFTDKPAKFKGWYKYLSVEGDSAGIVAMLTKYNAGTGQKDTIAEAIGVVLNTVSTYTMFDIDFVYNNNDIDPDSIIIVFTSSGDGGNFLGQAGSTLLVDDIFLEYPSGVQESLAPEFSVQVFPSPANDKLSFEFNTLFPEKLSCFVFAIDGSLIQSFSPKEKTHNMDVSNWQQGKYIIQAYLGNTLVTTSKFLVVH